MLRFAADDPRLAGFDAVVDRVNRLAETSPGFVWRHPDAHRRRHRTRTAGVGDVGGDGGGDSGDDSDGDGGSSVTVVNLSTWVSYADLHRFVYRSVHGTLVRRRAEWFVTVPGPLTVLWWTPAGTRPTADDGLARLAYLRGHGPTPRAFTVRRRFTAAGRPERR